jgi:hypothetical protein
VLFAGAARPVNRFARSPGQASPLRRRRRLRLEMAAVGRPFWLLVAAAAGRPIAQPPAGRVQLTRRLTWSPSIGRRRAQSIGRAATRCGRAT